MTLFKRAFDLAGRGQWDSLIETIRQNPGLALEEDERGRTLLQICAGIAGSAGAMKALLSLGADPNHRASDGSNVLAASIVAGSRYGLNTLQEMEELLAGGADPNVVADAGMPALHWAISQNRLEHAHLLIARGANPNARTDDSPAETAHDIARRMGFVKAQELLSGL